jgi:hypothetical protein
VSNRCDMATTSRIRAIVALGAIATATFAPATANAAAPKVYCMQAFASDVPATQCDPSAFPFLPPADPDTITPISRLFGPTHESNLGTVMVEGNATPGSSVAVEISDGTKSIIRVATAAATADPSNDLRKGDFSIWFDPRTDLAHTLATVQELGSHSAGPGATPTMPNPSAADLGEVVLTITAVANVAGIDSDPLSIEIFKQAATPGDTFAPQLRNLRFPPEHWCHYAGRGAQIPGFGVSMGGDTNGKCSDLAYSGLGAIPDATWVLCTRYTSRIPDQIPNAFAEGDRAVIEAFDAVCELAQDCGGFQCQGFGGYSMCEPHCDEQCAREFADQYNELRSQYCRSGFDHSYPKQHAPVSGRAVDYHDAAGGLASEIKSIKITINQGPAVIRTYVDHFARNTSTSGSWGFELNINDFAPTYPGGTPYTITVEATDAWGNKATAVSNQINVYPY